MERVKEESSYILESNRKVGVCEQLQFQPKVDWEAAVSKRVDFLMYLTQNQQQLRVAQRVTDGRCP